MKGSVNTSQEKNGILRIIGLIAGPVLFFLFILFFDLEPGNPRITLTAAVTLLMAIWWITEAIPVPITALVPLILFPMLKIMNAKEVALPYANRNIFLFMGGFFIAMAMMRWKLHKRIALNIMKIAGTSPRRLILGFMIATGFLSMWISNTATTMMMVPIGISVIKQINSMVEEYNIKIIDKYKCNLDIALMLSIAYAASIGGIGTLVGTPPNIVFAGMVRSLFPDAPEIGFFEWMKVGVPMVIIFLPVCWSYLTYIMFPPGMREIPDGKNIIKNEINALGKMNNGEKVTLVVFIFVVAGWIFRKNIVTGLFTIPGWSDILGISKYVHDSTVAITGAILLFMIPVNFKERVFALNWEWARRIPWGVIILFGGGFALATGFQDTGLAKWIGGRLTMFSGMPLFFIIVSVCVMMTFLTEITSNTTTTTMMMPILASLAVGMMIHPFLLMIPAVVSASCAFMLPVATPPNAIVFGSGCVTIPKMAKAGLVLNLIGVVFVTVAVYMAAIPAFEISLGVMPQWIP